MGELMNADGDKTRRNLISELGNLYRRGLIKESTHRKYVEWLKGLAPTEAMPAK